MMFYLMNMNNITWENKTNNNLHEKTAIHVNMVYDLGKFKCKNITNYDNTK